MKAGVTEERSSKETSSLELVIDHSSCPNESKIDEIINEIVKAFALKNTKIECEVRGAKGMRRTRLVIKAVAKPGGEPIIAALEMFGWMIGNVRIYERVVKYSRT